MLLSEALKHIRIMLRAKLDLDHVANDLLRYRLDDRWIVETYLYGKIADWSFKCYAVRTWYISDKHIIVML